MAVLLSLILSSCGTGDEVPITTPAAPTESAGGTGTVEPRQRDRRSRLCFHRPQHSRAHNHQRRTGRDCRRRAGLHRPPEPSSATAPPYGSGITAMRPRCSPASSRASRSGPAPAAPLALYQLRHRHPCAARPPTAPEITIARGRRAQAARVSGHHTRRERRGLHGRGLLQGVCYTGVINAVKQASPNTKIICNSIYPVGRSYAQLDSIKQR